MAFETGGSSGVVDLLDKVRVFALGLGWSVDFSGSPATGVTAVNVLALSKDGVCVMFLADTAAGGGTDPGHYFGAMTYPGPFVSATDKRNQAGATPITWANKMPGPFQAYYLFGTGTYLHLVVEAQPGSFRHIGAGVIAKAGVVNSGAYAFGGRWYYDANYVNSIASGYHSIPWDSSRSQNGWIGTVVRADKDGGGPANCSIVDASSQTGALLGGWAGFVNSGDHAGPVVHSLMRQGPSSLTGRSPLIPAPVAVFRPSGFVSLVGAAPDVRFVRIDNLTPGEAVTLGADTWRVFPIVRKNGLVGQENSGVFGYAYRVVA